ncbi:FAD-dependent oxidoreductase [Vampirovibrio chlorellavorus]|uniref:FAD-dependent oxidoreductase n=1 Tax=Vampirovibrio chlorellavorus TaxID=758823 RepID=UPI0026EC4E08|nr:FAD-dependent oxidoreductase [Vampirovibrio chlorellavorus]
MSQTVGIVGTGLLGRLLALTLRQRGWQVSLFDKDGPTVPHSCGYAGAGMLSPISELESAEPLIARLGFDSLPLWRQLIDSLNLSVYFQTEGTLIVAHHLDSADLHHFRHMLQGKLRQCQNGEVPATVASAIDWQLSSGPLAQLEPELSGRFHSGIFIPEEGQLDNRQLLIALENALNQAEIQCHWYTPVQALQGGQLETPSGHWRFDWVIDCRGLGAKPDWKNVRGVRGEIVRVYAPEVNLRRPVRLMHPRYPLYIAPRENHHYVIGATSIESEDSKPMTVQSAMELLSAAFAVHEGFAEASILDSLANCRPALPDHLPQLQLRPGLLRINGLYRHGFLIAPQVVQLACELLSGQPIPEHYQAIIQASTASGQAMPVCP